MAKVFTAEIVRHLKGAPLSVFIVLSHETNPVDQGHIERATGWTDKSVQKALLFLFENGIVVRVDRYHWQLSGEMRADYYPPFLLRGYKGASLSILVLLSLVRQPVGQEYLQRMSGYTNATIQSALLFLLEAGHVSRIDRYHWQLSNGRVQLPLGTKSLEDGQDQTHKFSESQLDATHKISESQPGLTHNISESSQTMTHENSESQPDMTHKISESNKEDVLDTTENSELFEGTPNNSGSDTEIFGVDCPSSSRLLTNLNYQDRLLLQDLEESQKTRVASNLAACDKWGIFGKAREEISLLPHVTATLIEYHCSTMDEKDRGLSIYRIRKGYRIGKKWEEQQESASEIQTILNLPRPTYNDAPIIPQDEWSNVLQSIESNFRHADFATWLQGGTTLVDQTDKVWTISVCNPYVGRWIRDHALELLEKASGVTINIVCNGKLVE